MTRLDALSLVLAPLVLAAGARVTPAEPLVSPSVQQETEDEGSEADQKPTDDTWRGPLAHRNQFPPAFLFLSLQPERARVLSAGERTVFVNFDYSNIITLHDTESESFEVDLESLRTLLRAQFGLGRDFEVVGSLPIYWMHAGFLDPFISGFHNAFDLPNQVREVEPDNIFRYSWRVDDQPVLEREEGFVALGDLTFQVKRAIHWKEWPETELAARAAIKLPTGSRSKLVSSGGTDVGFGVELSRVGPKVGGFFNLSYHVTSDLDAARSKNYLSWMAAVDWRFKPTLSAVLQYDEFTPILESDVKVLKQNGRQLVLGLRWRRSDRFQFEWRFAEDLSTTSADFTLGFQLTYAWKKQGAELPEPLTEEN